MDWILQFFFELYNDFYKTVHPERETNSRVEKFLRVATVLTNFLMFILFLIGVALLADDAHLRGGVALLIISGLILLTNVVLLITVRIIWKVRGYNSKEQEKDVEGENLPPQRVQPYRQPKPYYPKPSYSYDENSDFGKEPEGFSLDDIDEALKYGGEAEYEIEEYYGDYDE